MDDLVGAGMVGLVLAGIHYAPKGPIRTTVTRAEAAYARLRITRAMHESVRGEPYRYVTNRQRSVVIMGDEEFIEPDTLWRTEKPVDPAEPPAPAFDIAAQLLLGKTR